MSARHEDRHVPGAEDLWNEAWSFEIVDDHEGEIFIALRLFPNLGKASWQTRIVDQGRVVVVRDDEVSLPRAGGFEVRAEGLWGELICETRMEHWGIRLEAFGLVLDNPAQSPGGSFLDFPEDERGERIPVGLDLDWELYAAPPEAVGTLTDDVGEYRQLGEVHGEVLIGSDRIVVSAPGVRAHEWGKGQ